MWHPKGCTLHINSQIPECEYWYWDSGILGNTGNLCFFMPELEITIFFLHTPKLFNLPPSTFSSGSKSRPETPGRNYMPKSNQDCISSPVSQSKTGNPAHRETDTCDQGEPGNPNSQQGEKLFTGFCVNQFISDLGGIT